MILRHALLATACGLALAACGNDPASAAPEAATPSTAQAPADTAAAAPADPADAMPTDAAVAGECTTVLEGNDAMQFDKDAITVPSSCTGFTITLRHVGTLPVTAMGHNVVIAPAADMDAVATEGMAAGPDNAYVKPGDPRVVAHSGLVGGGQETTVTFDVADITGGDFMFFCSFPGHPAMMRGTIAVQ